MATPLTSPAHLVRENSFLSPCNSCPRLCKKQRDRDLSIVPASCLHRLDWGGSSTACTAPGYRPGGTGINTSPTIPVQQTLGGSVVRAAACTVQGGLSEQALTPGVKRHAERKKEKKKSLRTDVYVSAPESRTGWATKGQNLPVADPEG